MSEDDPLTDLYVDKDDIDRQRLLNVLSGLIGIDKETGDPVYHGSYYELDNKSRFVSQILYREAARLLEEREAGEIGANSATFAETLDSSESAVQNYASELEFVEHNEEQGGYVLRDHWAGDAIAYLQNARDESTAESP